MMTDFGRERSEDGRGGSAGHPELSLEPEELKTLLEELRYSYERWGAFQSTCPPSFQMPSDEMMQAALEAEGVAASRSFFADLVRCAAGGAVVPEILWDDFVRREAARRADTGIPADTEQLREHYRHRAALLREIEGACRNGESPPVAAARWVKTLFERGEMAAAADNSEFCLAAVPGDKDGERQLPGQFFGSPPSADEQLLEQLCDGGGAGRRHPGLNQEKAVLEDFLNEELKQHIREVARLLRSSSPLKSKAAVIERDSNSSIRVRSRPIESINEVSRVGGSDWALYQQSPALFLYRAASRGMPVSLPLREDLPAKRSVQKQLLYLLIDSSGSMAKDNGRRIGTAAAVLLNRLEAVVQGQAELYYAFFDGAVYDEHHCATKGEAQAAIEAVRSQNFSGGDTDIKGALQHAVRRVRKLAHESCGARPEIMIATDGGQMFYIDPEFFEGSVLHAVLCGGENAALSELARQTGGLVIEV